MINSSTEYVEPIDIKLNDFVKALGLSVYYDGERDSLSFDTVSVNRPGLILAGYDSYFADNRIQVLGMMEMTYLENLKPTPRKKVLESIFSREVPCFILARGLSPLPDMEKVAKKHKRPIFLSSQVTSNLINDLVTYLNEILAEKTIVSGVFMEVNGVGVLITGKSGIGKSETALELIKRGHRLVADDAVLVKNVRETLIGTAPEVIRFLMELRGIGIVDIRSIYGIGSVTKEREIEMIIQLEQWQENKSYERLRAENKCDTILGVDVPKLILPVKPGRNIAVIVEVAARNFKLQQEGFSAIDGLVK